MTTKRTYPLVGILVLALISTGIFFFAQKSVQAERPPIQNVLVSGETIIGEISPANPVPEFLLAANPGEILSIDVVGISPDLQPTLLILDSSGEVVAQEEFSAENSRAQAALFVFRPDRFSALVQSASNEAGEFAITVDRSEQTLEEVSALAPGQTMSGQVNVDTPVAFHTLDMAPTDNLMLVISSPTYLPPVLIQNTETGQLVGQVMPPVHAGMFCMGAGIQNQHITIMYSGTVPEQAYELALLPPQDALSQWCNTTVAQTGTEGSAFNPNAPDGIPNGVALTTTRIDGRDGNLTPPTDVFISLPDEPGTCQAASLLDVDATVHSLPVSGMQVVAEVEAEANLPVIGSVVDNTWLQVAVGGQAGWVNTLDVDVSGGCGSLPILNVLGWEPTPGLIVDINGNLLDMQGVDIGLSVNSLLHDSEINANVNASVGSSGINASADAALGDDGLNVDVDAGGDDGLNVDVDAGGDDGLNVDVDAGGDDGLNVDVDAGGDDGLNVDVDAGGDDGLNVDVDAGGDGGLNVDVDAGGDDGLNVEINIGGG